MVTSDSPLAAAEMQRRVDEHPFWYHTIDIAPRVATKGWFDLRPIVDQLPWPDVRGKRCLDIGTFDGYLAFELERRGASDVVAIDVEDHLLWDWPPDYRARDLPRDPGFTGPPKGAGFRLAHELMGSKVDWRALNIYDLSPDAIGTFDVVVCGTLLLHLRDPIRALEAVRSVTSGVFLSSEQIELWLSILGRGKPLFTLNGSGGECQWYNYNAAGHKRMLYAAGFEIEQVSRPYTVRFNEHPIPTAPRYRVEAAVRRVITGSAAPGILHRALLGRPRV